MAILARGGPIYMHQYPICSKSIPVARFEAFAAGVLPEWLWWRASGPPTLLLPMEKRISAVANHLWTCEVRGFIDSYFWKGILT